MYAELKMELNAPQLDFRQSSNLQGVIMELIDTQYASELHSNQLNPYSQYLEREADKVYWHIQTLTDEAYEKILLPLAKQSEIRLKHKDLSIPVGNRSIVTTMEAELMTEFYESECPRYLEIAFLTPTAFKQEGKYICYPALRLVYGSLMRKYSSISQELDMVDEDTLEELVAQSEIVRYRLQTTAFPLEQVRITGFRGNFCIRVRGAETLARYIRLLFRFGEFSGVGIKTGIGMGAMRYVRRERDDRSKDKTDHRKPAP